MDEKLELSDYLISCTEFEKDPENPVNIQKLNNFFDNLIIREYIPLREKVMITMEVLEKINKDFDAPGAAAFLEMGKIVTALLSYCVNLHNDVPFLSYGYFLVDMIYQHGLYDIIIDKCKKDCERLFKMIDDAMNASNIYRIIQTASLFDKDAYDEWLSSMEKLKDTLNSETLQELLDVMNSDPEGIKNISEQLKQVALEQTQKEIKEDSEKFKAASRLQPDAHHLDDEDDLEIVVELDDNDEEDDDSDNKNKRTIN